MTGYYFTDDWACARTGLHRTTIVRMRIQRRMRPELVRLAEIEIHGNLGLINDFWSGWTLARHENVLVTPHGWGFTPGELLAIPLRYQYMRALEAANRRLRAQIVANEQAPSPSVADIPPKLDVRAAGC